MKNIIILIALFFAIIAISKAESDTLWAIDFFPTQIYAVKFTPDGQYLAAGGSDGVVTIWNALTGDSVKSYKTNGYVWSTDISPNGKYLAMTNNSSQAKIYNLENDSLVATIIGYVVKFTSDGKYIITTSSGIFKYETQTWKLISQSGGSYHNDVPNNIDISSDNKYIITGSQSDIYNDTLGFVEIYNFSDLSWKKTLTYGKRISYFDICFSPDGKYLAVGSSDGAVKIYQTNNQQLYKTFNHSGGVLALSFSPDCNYLVEGGGVLQLSYQYLGNKLRNNKIYI
jgi:uncharacterized protein with WD repeat